MKQALKSGSNLWNGADFYGTPQYNSMTLLNKYFTQYPDDADKVTLVIKGGVDAERRIPDGSPEFTRKSADNILAQLGGKKKLDVFGVGRRDRKVPLETTLRVLQNEYVDTGKIGGISLSECSAETIHEAVKICKIALVEVELSMFTQDNLHNGVAAACAQYGIPLMAYSPISRGVRRHYLLLTWKTSAANSEVDSYRPFQDGRRFQIPRVYWNVPALPR
jgi:pyridoxine 4-dehydrogenase